MGPLVHHVFFWLKNPNSEEDRMLFLENLYKLKDIETVKYFHVGMPADTARRPVIDSSYTFTEMLVFDSVDDEAEYQSHPLHKAFIENCSHLWEKVLVYDSLYITEDLEKLKS
jgi:hypothetical protein